MRTSNRYLERFFAAALLAALTFSTLASSQTVKVSPAALSFGPVYIGYPQELNFVVRNAGAAPVNISNITSNHTKFIIIGNSNFALAANDSAKLTVKYAPTTAQSDSAIITITPSGFPAEKITARGSGLLPAAMISVNAAALKFGNVLAGKTSDLILNISNPGVLNLEVTLQLSNANFSVAEGVRHTILPGDTKSLTLRLTAPTLGSQADTLRLTSNDAANSLLKIPLTGFGNTIAVPEISVKPAQLKFDSVMITQSQTLKLPLYNRGTANLSLTNMKSNNARFALLTPTNLTILPGDSSEAAVQFNPTTAGAQATTLSMTCNDPNENFVAIRMSGVGNPYPLPALTSIQPGAGNRLQTLEVVFRGKNFIAGVSEINLGPHITINSLAVLSADSIKANITIGAGAAAGPRSFTVANNPPGGGISQSKIFTINNPVPTLATLLPGSAGRGQTVSVTFNGTNFIQDVSRVNAGAGITVNEITVSNSKNLVAKITIDLNATPGPRNFSVANIGPGGGASAIMPFTVNNPAPILTSLNPGDGGRLQTLNAGFKGANFISGISTVKVGDGLVVNQVTVHRLDTLTANITIEGDARLGQRSFAVINSEPGGGTSAGLIFIVGNSAPALAKINPLLGNRLQTLDIGFKGSNFIDGVTEVNLGPNITLNKTTVHRPDSLTANLTIGAGAMTGPRNITVTNDPPGGGVSSSKVFTINNPAPALVDLLPSAAGRGQTVSVVFNGANFIQDVSRLNTGAGITVNEITVSNAKKLVAKMTIDLNATPGPRSFSVANIGPGGGASEVQTFMVNNPAPGLTAIKPANAERLQILNVGFKGMNFFPGISTVKAGDGIIVNQVTVHRFDSLTANLTVEGNARTGQRSFAVVNAEPGGGTSTGIVFIVGNAAPALTSIKPNNGGRLQTLEVVCQGINFIDGVSRIKTAADITLNRITVHRHDSLTANITISADATPGPRNFVIANNNLDTEAQIFTINNPAPTLTRMAPAAAVRGQQLHVTFSGANFINNVTFANAGAGITINSTTVNSPTSLTANLRITEAAPRGARRFSLINIAPGGGISGDQFFTILNSEPTKPNLVAPENNKLLELAKPFQPLRFIWNKSFDIDPEDTLKYFFTLKGPGVDTTIANVKDTSVVLHVTPSLKVASEYSWSVRVSDGLVTVTWPDRFVFRTSSTITIVTEKQHLVPEKYRLEQNFPNPFLLSAANANTTIRYELPQAAFVSLKIYDALGREVASLINALQQPGYHQILWDGKNTNGELAPDGVYIYRWRAGNFGRMMKMIVVR